MSECVCVCVCVCVCTCVRAYRCVHCVCLCGVYIQSMFVRLRICLFIIKISLTTRPYLAICVSGSGVSFSEMKIKPTT